MKILMDTNFILTTAKQKIDFPSLANKIIDEDIEWIVPQEVLNELGNLKDRPGMKISDREAACLGFDLLCGIEPKPTVLDLKLKHPNIDQGIINYLIDKPIVLATMDKGMKKKLDNKILTVRGKKSLELI